MANENAHILILIGKSASGKDTVQKELVQNYGYAPIISTTSRPMREGEKEGINYFYVSKEDFEKRIENGDFLEYRAYNTTVAGKDETWYYGTSKMDLNGNFVTVLDIEGAKAFIDFYGHDVCTVCYVDALDKLRHDRAMQRGSFDIQEWNRRYLDDEKVFSFEAVSNISDFMVVNNWNLLETVKEVVAADIVEQQNHKSSLSIESKDILGGHIYTVTNNKKQEISIQIGQNAPNEQPYIRVSFSSGALYRSYLDKIEPFTKEIFDDLEAATCVAKRIFIAEQNMTPTDWLNGNDRKVFLNAIKDTETDILMRAIDNIIEDELDIEDEYEVSDEEISDFEYNGFDPAGDD